MKTLFYTSPLIVLAFFAGYLLQPSCEQSFGGLAQQITELQNEKIALLKRNIIVENRAKQNPQWDVSVVSAAEFTAAWEDVREEWDIDAGDLLASGGDSNAALRAKLGANSMLCDNPNATAKREKIDRDKNFVRP